MIAWPLKWIKTSISKSGQFIKRWKNGHDLFVVVKLPTGVCLLYSMYKKPMAKDRYLYVRVFTKQVLNIIKYVLYMYVPFNGYILVKDFFLYTFKCSMKLKYLPFKSRSAEYKSMSNSSWHYFSYSINDLRIILSFFQICTCYKLWTMGFSKLEQMSIKRDGWVANLLHFYKQVHSTLLSYCMYIDEKNF